MKPVNLIQVSIQEATLDVSSLEEEKVTFYEPDDEERSPSTRPASPPQASPSPCPPAATPSPRPPSVHVMPPSPRPPSVMEEPPTEPEEDKVEHTEKAGKEEQYHSGDEGGKCFCRPESSWQETFVICPMLSSLMIPPIYPSNQHPSILSWPSYQSIYTSHNVSYQLSNFSYLHSFTLVLWLQKHFSLNLWRAY